MPVNRISLAVSQAQRQAALDAVSQTWTALPGLIALEPGELKELHPFVNKRELLGRGVLDAFEAHPQMAPASLNVAGARADLDALDTLRPILAEVRRLHSMLEDTVALLGHDVMDFAYEGYQQLKLSGAAHGLEDLRKELGGNAFARRRRAAEAPAAA